DELHCGGGDIVFEFSLREHRCSDHQAKISRYFFSEKPTLTLPAASTVTGRLTNAGNSAINASQASAVSGVLRSGGRLRQVMEARFTSFSQPPRASAQAVSTAGATGCAR